MITVIEPHGHNFPGARYGCGQTNLTPGQELRLRTVVHQSCRGHSLRVSRFQERRHAREGPGRNSRALSRSAQIDDALLGEYPETPHSAFSRETDESHRTFSWIRLNLLYVKPCPLCYAARKRSVGRAVGGLKDLKPTTVPDSRAEIVRRNTAGGFTVSSAPTGRPRHIVEAPHA